MNIVIIKGRLTRDPEVKYTQSGTATCRLTVAVDRYSKDQENQADFISCTAFGKSAENIGKYFGKGSEIAVRGSIKTGSYEKDGRKIYTTEVWVEGFEFCGSKAQSQTSAPAAAAPAPAPAQYAAPAPSYQQASLPPEGFVPVDASQFTEDLPF